MTGRSAGTHPGAVRLLDRAGGKDPTGDGLAWVQAAQTLSEITGIAISPLLGVGTAAASCIRSC